MLKKFLDMRLLAYIMLIDLDLRTVKRFTVVDINLRLVSV
jgi:hypothetical protein